MSLSDGPWLEETAGKESPSGRRRNVVLWLLLVVLAGSILYRFGRDRYYVAQPIVVNAENAERLADKINPNTATWASLARLPGIGMSKAKEIVRYRENFRKENKKENKAFCQYMDLCLVKGIGDKTAEQIKEYLIFDDYGTMGSKKK